MTGLRSSIVSKARKIVVAVPIVAVLAAAGVRVGTAIAAQDTAAQTQNAGTDPDTNRKAKNVAAGEVEAKRLLLLMDRDQNGKVSRQEFMSFMESEFERLDVNKDGELDVKELVHTRLTPHVGTHR
jgi:hypothetical protein